MKFDVQEVMKLKEANTEATRQQHGRSRVTCSNWAPRERAMKGRREEREKGFRQNFSPHQALSWWASLRTNKKA